MLEERIDEWKAQWWREAHLEGEAAVVLRLLQSRFGEVPAEVVQRIQRAGHEDLMLWSDRLLDAENLHSVFDENSRR